jgi:digeranylgeranylglycerophospholipid reductase
VTLYDSLIIGAGAAGSYLAYRLAHLGYKVIVVDKKAAPGDNVCCTGILSVECLKTFAFDDSLVLRQASSAKFFSPSGKCLRLRQDSPVAVIVDRAALDMSLAKQAQEAGADYLLGAKVADVVSQPAAVKVRVDGQEAILKAKTAVIATGFGSPLPEKLGLGKIELFLLGAQAEVHLNGIDEIEVYFDQNLAPGSFAWLAPTKNGKGLAGLLTRDKADLCLKGFLDTLSSQGKITSGDVSPRYGTIPLGHLPKTYTDRILVVGEAAGQVKPATGGGIYYSLLCADIAADVLHRAFQSGNFSSIAFSDYQKRWRARLSPELTIGYWARHLYAKLSNDYINHLFDIAAKDGIGDLITSSDNFFFDWHGRLLLALTEHLLPLSGTIKTSVIMPGEENCYDSG